MKNIFLVGGILAILFNSLIGLIVTKYPPFNWLLADVSIFITAGLIYALYTKYLDNAFQVCIYVFIFNLRIGAVFTLSICKIRDRE